jgi:pimeloyl-ACP methyl ester carboxylesterase
MPHVTANGIQIEYDTFGDRSSPALLLVAGNGAQLIFWEVEFCELLAKKGFFLIRFDNRDAGLSTKFEEAGIPDFPTAIKAAMEGKPVESAYSLDDMADDAVCLLNALDIEKANICGLSMGGNFEQPINHHHFEKQRNPAPSC